MRRSPPEVGPKHPLDAGAERRREVAEPGAENREYADAFELDLSPPRTVTVEVRSDGEEYAMVARHDHGTAAFCASSETGAIVEGTDC